MHLLEPDVQVRPILLCLRREAAMRTIYHSASSYIGGESRTLSANSNPTKHKNLHTSSERRRGRRRRRRSKRSYKRRSLPSKSQQHGSEESKFAPVSQLRTHGLQGQTRVSRRPSKLVNQRSRVRLGLKMAHPGVRLCLQILRYRGQSVPHLWRCP